MTRLERIKSYILDLEERFPVNDWRIEGIRIWPHLRCRLAVSMNHADINGDEGTKGAWRRRLEAAWCRLSRNTHTFARRRRARRTSPPLPQHGASAVYFGDGVSFADLDGRMYERLFEPLAEGLAQRGVPSVMLTGGHNYPTPCRLPQLFVQPAMDAAALAGILGPEPRFADEQLDGIQGLLDALAADGQPGTRLSLAEIRKGVGHIFRFKRFFARQLERCGAGLGLVVDFDGVAGMGFTLACRERGIACVVVQHGAQPEAQALYGGWYSVPPEGYELLPTHFWVREQKDAKKFERWMAACPGAHEVIVGGNPFLDTWLQGEASFVRLFDRKLAGDNSARRVLVALHGLERFEDDFMAQMITETLRRAPGCRFWIRSHPCRPEQAERLGSMLGGTERAACDLSAKDLPLYALLRHVDAVAAMHSSTVEEAAAFGAGVVLLHELGADLYPHLLEKGAALYTPTPQEAAEALASQGRRPAAPDPASAKNFSQGLERLCALVREEGSDG